MKQGIFDIIRGKPIVFAYGLPKPNAFHQAYSNGALEEYEASRQEWDVENIIEDSITGEKYIRIEKPHPTDQLAILPEDILCKRNIEVQFIEILPPIKDKEGKCRIVKII